MRVNSSGLLHLEQDGRSLSTNLQVAMSGMNSL
jgi:hypothetical protein